MNASTPRGKAVRSRASQRLRNLTIGTTLAGMAASAGFGWLASATYDGTGATAANPTSSSTTTSEVALPTPSATTGTTGTTGTSNDSSSSSSSSSSSGLSRSSGPAHVSTGGS